MEIGWTELMVIAIVALVVIGPKDLPDMFRTLGRFTAKLRAMSRDFSRAMEDAARESGVKDVADDLRKVTSPKSMGLDAVKSAADKFEKWDPLKGTRITPGSSTPSATTAGTATTGTATATSSAAAAAGLGSAAAAIPAAALAQAAAEQAATVAPASAQAADLAAPAVPNGLATEGLGPNTAALAQKQAERKAIAAEAAAKLRAQAADRAATSASPVVADLPGDTSLTGSRDSGTATPAAAAEDKA